MILLVDNYDSFTYNLFDALSQAGADVLVRRNDALSVRDISNLSPAAIVISPGPKKPSDAGITPDLIHHFHALKPILGICLGYQALGEYFGATLVKSKIPVHGKSSLIKLEADPIFEHIESETEVMRYHSLNISNIPATLKIIARTAENEPMALKHNTLPLYGFQFHPESILSKDGLQMLKNWYRLIQ